MLQKTFVKMDWVDKNKMNGKVVEVITINPGEQTYPVAPINIEVAGYKTDLEVAVHSSWPYDVLLGRHFSNWLEVGFREINLASCNMFKTRQQKKLEDNMGCTSDSPSKIVCQVKDAKVELDNFSSEPGQESDSQISYKGESIYNETTAKENLSSQSEDYFQDDSNTQSNSMHGEIPYFADITPEIEGRVSKTKLTRSEKRASKQAHAALVALPQILDHTPEDMKREQRKDESLKPLWKEAQHRGLKFKEENGLLWRKVLNKLHQSSLQLVIPEPYISGILRLAHKPGHLGRKNTIAQLSEHFYWPGFSKDVKNVCDSCFDCQKVGRQRKSVAPLQTLPIIDTPFSRIAMDFVGPLPRTKQGKRYIIVLMDYATRWPEAKAVSAPTSRAAVDVILDICNRFGVPKEILTDTGSHFVNVMLRNVYKRLRIHHITTTPYHPQTDGMVERYNGTLKSMLKRSLSTFHGQWDQALPFVLGEYRKSL